MKRYAVAFSPAAQHQLEDLRRYIAEQASPAVANGYIDRIVALSQSLDTFPLRGTPREDLPRGVRTVTLKRRVTVAYRVVGSTVFIVGIAYGGRDLSRLFS